jgi:hypothetical protein
MFVLRFVVLLVAALPSSEKSAFTGAKTKASAANRCMKPRLDDGLFKKLLKNFRMIYRHMQRNRKLFGLF